MAAGTATTVVSGQIGDYMGAYKLLEVNFAGVQGNAGPATVRAVASEAVNVPARCKALGLYIRATNNGAGPAGDEAFGIIELVMPGAGGPVYQLVSTDGLALNLNGSTLAVGAACTYANGIGGQVTSPGLTTDPAVGATVSPAAGFLSGIPLGAQLSARIAVGVTTVAAVSGTPNYTAELWALLV